MKDQIRLLAYSPYGVGHAVCCNVDLSYRFPFGGESKSASDDQLPGGYWPGGRCRIGCSVEPQT